ncbi:MAG TPA: hypothetical protein VJ732_03530 [Bryobacteraceae bacterium]|nr:hypothetical protein [Bryobacteraceae bacterium]
MPKQLATHTFTIAEPFEEAVRCVRSVLSSRGLKIVGELNVSGRIRKELRVGTAPCRLLLVCPRASVWESLGGDPGGMALTPLHVVLSGRGLHTEVHVLKTIPVSNDPLDQPVLAAWSRLQEEITEAIETVGMLTV